MEHRKVPWRLSRHQKYRHRERLRHVDSVVSTLDTALRRMGQSMKKVERWKTEMPTEEEMLPKDKYTVFDRKVKRYRKGIHSKWHTLRNFATDAFGGSMKDMGNRLRIYSDDLQRFPSGRGSVSDSILQVSRWPSWQKMAKYVHFTVTIRIAFKALWKGGIIVYMILPPQKHTNLVSQDPALNI